MTATPTRCASCGESNSTGRPANVTDPVEGRNTPASSFTQVLLPAPFSPSSASTSPRRRPNVAAFRAAIDPDDLPAASRPIARSDGSTACLSPSKRPVSFCRSNEPLPSRLDGSHLLIKAVCHIQLHFISGVSANNVRRQAVRPVNRSILSRITSAVCLSRRPIRNAVSHRAPTARTGTLPRRSSSPNPVRPDVVGPASAMQSCTGVRDSHRIATGQSTGRCAIHSACPSG